MKKKEFKPFNIEHIDIKVAEKIHKDLCKKLEKADNKKVFDYDINAHSEFCAEVVKMMDVMIGQIRKKYEK